MGTWPVCERTAVSDMDERAIRTTTWLGVGAAGASVTLGAAPLAAGGLAACGVIGAAEALRAYRPIIRPEPVFEDKNKRRAIIKIHNRGRVVARACSVRIVSVEEVRPKGIKRRMDIGSNRLSWCDINGAAMDVGVGDDPEVEVITATFPNPVARMCDRRIWERGQTLVTLRITGENFRAVERTYLFRCLHRRYEAPWEWDEWRQGWLTRKRYPPLPTVDDFLRDPVSPPQENPRRAAVRGLLAHGEKGGVTPASRPPEREKAARQASDAILFVEGVRALIDDDGIARVIYVKVVNDAAVRAVDAELTVSVTSGRSKEEFKEPIRDDIPPHGNKEISIRVGARAGPDLEVRGVLSYRENEQPYCYRYHPWPDGGRPDDVPQFVRCDNDSTRRVTARLEASAEHLAPPPAESGSAEPQNPASEEEGRET